MYSSNQVVILLAVWDNASSSKNLVTFITIPKYPKLKLLLALSQIANNRTTWLLLYMEISYYLRNGHFQAIRQLMVSNGVTTNIYSLSKYGNNK